MNPGQNTDTGPDTARHSPPRWQTVRFSGSAARIEQLPPDHGAEVAFAGRSNAGKSSGLNALTGHKRLARISKTPGRTQLINFFELSPDRRLVDLPGYGYAKVPEAMRRRWQQLLEQYLSRRQTLRGLFLFMDVRHPLTPLDRQLLDWCRHRRRNLYCHVLLTKADKLKRGAAAQQLRRVRDELGRDHPDAGVQLFSAASGEGVTAARDQLQRLLCTAAAG